MLIKTNKKDLLIIWFDVALGTTFDTVERQKGPDYLITAIGSIFFWLNLSF